MRPPASEQRSAYNADTAPRIAKNAVFISTAAVPSGSPLGSRPPQSCQVISAIIAVKMDSLDSCSGWGGRYHKTKTGERAFFANKGLDDSRVASHISSP
jgi:hypothetical protein